MKKSLSMLSMALMLLGAKANALDFKPYISTKASFVQMKNDVNSISNAAFTTGSLVTKNITLSDKTHKDEVPGIRFSTGLYAPVKHGSLRGELELGWNGQTESNNNFIHLLSIPGKFGIKSDVYTAMFNVYYDINTNSKFTPYIGAGFGYAHTRMEISIKSQNSSVNKGNMETFVWNIGTGLSYDINEKTKLDVGYRYTDYGDITTSKFAVLTPGTAVDFNTGDINLSSHEFSLGLRYSF